MKLKEEDIKRINKSVSRNVELEFGLRRPTHMVYKNRKKYTRKIKNKKCYEI